MHFNFFPTFVAIQRCIFLRLVECIAIKQLVHPDGRVLVNLLPLCAAHERKKVFENLNEISERLLQYLCKWVAQGGTWCSQDFWPRTMNALHEESLKVEEEETR